MQPQWKVETEGGAAPLTITMQVAGVTVATENGDQIALTPEQVAPLVQRLDNISYYLNFGED